MIKFIRKLRYDLISDNKTGKYFKYAIGEILLVVIGILIALQINNWNEARKYKIKESHFIGSFKIDVISNIEELNRVIDKSERTYLTIDSVLQDFKNQSYNFSLDDLGDLIMAGTSYTVYGTSEGTIDDILGSGQLEIIKQDSIRHAIGSWQSHLKWIREWEAIEKKSVDDYTDRIYNYLDLHKYREGDILTSTSKEDMFKDRVFINLLTDRKFYPKRLNALYKEELVKLESLLELIEKN